MQMQALRATQSESTTVKRGVQILCQFCWEGIKHSEAEFRDVPKV